MPTFASRISAAAAAFCMSAGVALASSMLLLWMCEALGSGQGRMEDFYLYCQGLGLIAAILGFFLCSLKPHKRFAFFLTTTVIVVFGSYGVKAFTTHGMTGTILRYISFFLHVPFCIIAGVLAAMVAFQWTRKLELAR